MTKPNTTRRAFLGHVGLAAAATALPGALPAVEKGKRPMRKPNILFIMADDLGPEWVGCYGSESIETPNIDKLAAGGMQFANAYSMPQCTPTRATLLTGQYPFRHGWINHWDVPRWGAGCHFDPKHNPSFGRVMKSAGYATAIAGKWQINDFRVQPKILIEHGFDEYCMWTGYESGNPPSGKRYWDPYIHTAEGSKTYGGKFGEDVFADFLIDFMKRHKDKPMMLYYPMCLPHGPMTTTPLAPDVADRVGRHKAMVRYIDHITGKLVAALEALGIRDNTIIIWTTDNGSGGGIVGRMKGRDVRGGKAKASENGICAPFIVNGPSLVPAGVKTDALTDFTDMLPTFAELGGAELPKGATLDGKSIAKLLLGKADDSPREWIMAMGSHPGTVNAAGRVVPVHEYRDRVLRDKQYKLWIDTAGQSAKLFDLLADPGETNNLIDSTDPKHVAARKKFEAVAATFPKTDGHPRYDPTPPQPWDRKPGKPKGRRPKKDRGKLPKAK